MNVIARLELELAYFEVAVQDFSHYTMRTLNICYTGYEIYMLTVTIIFGQREHFIIYFIWSSKTITYQYHYLFFFLCLVGHLPFYLSCHINLKKKTEWKNLCTESIQYKYNIHIQMKESSFEIARLWPQSKKERYYTHFWTNTLVKGYYPLIPPPMYGLNSITDVLLQVGFFFCIR